MGYGKLAVFAIVITGASRKMHVQGVTELEESNSHHLSRHCLPGLSLRGSKYLILKGLGTWGFGNSNCSKDPEENPCKGPPSLRVQVPNNHILTQNLY